MPESDIDVWLKPHVALVSPGAPMPIAVRVLARVLNTEFAEIALTGSESIHRICDGISPPAGWKPALPA